MDRPFRSLPDPCKSEKLGPQNLHFLQVVKLTVGQTIGNLTFFGTVFVFRHLKVVFAYIPHLDRPIRSLPDPCKSEKLGPQNFQFLQVVKLTVGQTIGNLTFFGAVFVFRHLKVVFSHISHLDHPNRSLPDPCKSEKLGHQNLHFLQVIKLTVGQTIGKLTFL